MVASLSASACPATRRSQRPGISAVCSASAAVVDLPDARPATLFSSRNRVGVERVRQHLRARVAAGLRLEVLQRLGQGQELAERIPAQVVLLLRNCCTCLGAARRAGLEQAAAVHQRHDRQHLGAGAELHDREQVGEVVAQHVAGPRWCPAGADALSECRIARTGLRMDVQPGGVVFVEVGRDLGDQPAVVGAARRARTPPGMPVARARDRQLDPVLDRDRPVWHMRQMSPAFDRLLQQHGRRWSSTTRTVPSAASRRSCRGCRIPRPSAPSGRRWAREPMVAGSNAPWRRQSSITAW